MSRALLRKNIRESRLLLTSCCLALYGFCWLRVWISSRVEMGQFSKVVELLWDEYERFSPVPLSQLSTYSGRLAIIFQEPIVLLCIIVWAISRGSDVVSGELSRGTMEMVISQPVSRLQHLVSQAMVTVTGLFVLTVVCWLGLSTGIQTNTVKQDPPGLEVFGFELTNPFSKAEEIRVPMSDEIDPGVLYPATVNLFSFGLCIAGLTTFFSACDRFRSRTIGIAVGVVVVQMAIGIVSLAIEWLGGLQYLTFFTAYQPEVIVSVTANQPEFTWSLYRPGRNEGEWLMGPLGYNLVLAGIGLAGYIAAGIVFSKRDLPPPL